MNVACYKSDKSAITSCGAGNGLNGTGSGNTVGTMGLAKTYNPIL